MSNAKNGNFSQGDGRSEKLCSGQILNQAEIDYQFGFKPPETCHEKFRKFARRRCTTTQLKASLISFFPIISWIRVYNWKLDPIRDLLGGLTVGIMSIPQGMSYAGLIRIPFVYGLYTNIIPTMLYPFVGTSKHGAVGTVTMVSLMLGQIRLKYIPDTHDILSPGCYDLLGNTSRNLSWEYDNVDPAIFSSPKCFSASQMVISIALLGGFMMAAMGICRLGFVGSYLSDCVVDGFTAGAAVVVVTAQLDYLLGIRVPPYSGIGKVFVTYAYLFTHLTTINLATLIITLICVVCLLLMKELVNPFVQRRIRVPIPAELLAVIIATIVSFYGQVESKYRVKVVGKIPSGFPTPRPVRFDIMPELFVDTLLVTIVNYSLSISLAKLMAKKNNYKIDTQQEFYAFSVINIAGSIFQSFQSGISVARTIVYESTGAASQFAGLIGTICVIVCVMWLAPYLYSLPQCILGSIILAACIELLKNLRQLKNLWKVSKFDFSIFLVTFIAVVVCDVTIGLAIAVIYNFLTVVLRSQWTHVRVLGKLGDTDAYGEINRYEKTDQVPGIKIFQFNAPLYYANVENFKTKLYEHCEKNQATRHWPFMDRKLGDGGPTRRYGSPKHPNEKNYVILNCCGMSFIDVMGIKAFKEVFIELEKTEITLLYAACNVSVRSTLECTDFYSIVSKDHLFFCVNDAVEWCQANQNVQTDK